MDILRDRGVTGKSRNKLLEKLSPGDLREITAEMEEVELTFKFVLHAANSAISHIYFPTDGVVSVVNEPDDGEIVEIATVGSEGFVGFPVLLGASSIPSTALVQVAGRGLRMKVAGFRRAIQRFPKFNALLLRYTMALLNQIAQSTSCNRLHEVQERCARWLLQTHDRVDGDSFELTQEFLSQMLGVHRPTVSIAAGMLQKAGLIEYSRGVITIVDRKGLEAASCNCYRLIADEYKRLLQIE
jgi:CRP-like cAMP-binding protein